MAGIDAAAVRKAMFASGLGDRYETGAITSDQFHEEFCQIAGAPCSREEMMLAVSDIFWLNSGMAPVVAQLAAAGHPLGILSNTCDVHWRWVTDGRYRMLPGRFQKFALSFEIGAMKPQPAIYEAAARLAGVAPEKIFFVDDRPENVAGALAAGYDAVPFTSSWKLAADLQARGVKFNF